LFRLGNTSSQEKKHCEPPNREPQGPNWAFWVCARLQDLQFFAGRKSTNLRTGFRNNHFTAGQIVPLGAKFTPKLTLWSCPCWECIFLLLVRFPLLNNSNEKQKHCRAPKK
jgi:hypothetical protein